MYIKNYVATVEMIPCGHCMNIDNDLGDWIIDEATYLENDSIVERAYDIADETDLKDKYSQSLYFKSTGSSKPTIALYSSCGQYRLGGSGSDCREFLRAAGLAYIKHTLTE